MKLLQDFALIVTGLSGGIAVGSGFVAFITVLDIIPRLTQLTSSASYIRSYEWALITGVLFFTLIDFFVWVVHLPAIVTAVFGVFAGLFVGTLAAGLTEVLNVFPILAKRISLQESMLWLLMAMVFGKMIGSLLQWLLQL
ncbi:stage V sporulation protein AB [Brevibacillus fluminis]|uniref:Stage V sporulation protein AB n=1 Tax=Brevibacillus fluminis TaxID=511487 RepID=A0A3M8D109_9BACL|nr:stage V sporulation protein AB [Brevibacillus fluminis]RNB81568.1 stage V sporulation protein AB [Brevibacillus fluminis]